MKKILIPILMLLPFWAAAQNSYTISGKIPALKESAMVYLALVQEGAWKDIDSSEVKNGKFSFQGAVSNPQEAILRVKRINTPQAQYRPDQLGFFLENSKITIAATDSIKNATVSGSVSDQENRALDAQTTPLTREIIQIQNEYAKKPIDPQKGISEDRKKAGERVTELVAEIKNIKRRFVESHPNSFLGLYTYHHSILDSKFDPLVEEPLFKRFSAELQSSELGKRTVEKIESGKRRQTGILATDFTQKDLHDKDFTLSSLRGKYVLVDFWASWCGPCRAENPNLVKAYAKLKDKNFEIVGVSLDESKASWEGAVKQDGLDWIHVSDLKGWKNVVGVMYGINSVPQNLLIDPQGMIIAKNLRGKALYEKLNELIK